MSYSTEVPTNDLFNWNQTSCQISSKTVFLKFLYNCLQKNSGNKIDMYTLFQICNLPLIVSQKLISNSFRNKNLNVQENKNNENDDNKIDFLCLKCEEFVSGFYNLYFGNNIEKTRLIANFCSFSDNLINIKDVRLLLLHFHMRFLYDDENEVNLKKLISAFFEDKDNYTVEEFIQRSIEKNFDIVHIFITFFEKFKFFNNEQIKLFEQSYLNHLKIWKKSQFNSVMPLNNIYDLSNNMNNESISTNAFNLSMKPKSAFVEKINEHYNVSKKAEEYSNLINNSFIEFEPFEAEDNEMRKKMEEFDKDLFNTISSIQNNVVKNISIKPIKIGKYEMEKLTKKALSPINTINNKNKNNFSTAIQQFYNQSESDEDKEENSNFMTINNTKTYKINSNINTSLLSSSYSENNKYIEIKCYKLAKTLTKFKKVKLILADNILFYYSYDIKKNDINYNKVHNLCIFKSMIMISQLYPSIIINPLIPNNLYNTINVDKHKSLIYQYQIFSILHNKQIIYNFFFNNKEDIEILDNHIKSVQHLREISKYYNIKSKKSKEIGSGHFGKVILSTHNITQEKLAIKIIYKQYERGNSLKNKKIDENIEEIRKIENFKCLQWEKDIFTFLSHLNNAPNIIKCYEHFENLKYIYYVYEYCSGGNLKKLKLPKNLKLINYLSKHLISGLYTLHSYGIIHRDIKNTNTIICEREDGKNVLKIIDFGLSKVMGTNEFAYEGYGSLPYKAPEQLLGKKYSFPVDIWALGISVYWLINNTFPYNCDNKHKMKQLIVKYEYKNDDDNGGDNFFYKKILSHTLVNDFRKRANILELMKYKEIIY